MEEILKREIDNSVERLLNNFGSIHWIDLAMLRGVEYPLTIEDKKKLLMSLIIER